MADIPNLAGVATSELVEKIGSGNFQASYINWSRTLHLLRENATGWLPGVDLRGEGGYVLVAPSTHESGGVYEWISEQPIAELGPLLGPLRSARGAPGGKRRDGTDAPPPPYDYREACRIGPSAWAGSRTLARPPRRRTRSRRPPRDRVGPSRPRRCRSVTRWRRRCSRAATWTTMIRSRTRPTMRRPCLGRA